MFLNIIINTKEVVMKIVIAGANGMLGSALSKVFDPTLFEVISLDKQSLDITDNKAVHNLFKNNKDVKYFLNCAAYTDVPKSETERDVANKMNNYGPHILARNCLENNIHLIHFSTDFVFDGLKNEPYTEDDKTNPVNIYGLSKLLGENSIKSVMAENPLYTIFRVQWLFGDSDKHFFEKILKAYENNNKIDLVSDEFGSPCSVDFISSTILECLENEKIENLKGHIVNLTHDNSCSRYECGKYFLSKFGFNNVNPIESIDDGKMKRPKYGVLSNKKLSNFLNKKLGTWEKDLDIYFKNKFEGKNA